MRKILLLPIIVLLSSCVYEDTSGLVENNEEVNTVVFDSLQGANEFSFSMVEERDFVIEIQDHNNNPYPDARFTLLNSKGNKIISAATNSDGRFTLDHQLVTSEEQLYLTIDALGISQDTIEIYAEDLTIFAGSPVSRSRAGANGLPDSLAEDVYISSAVLSDINAAFPERSKVHIDHPEYIQQGAISELITSDNAEVWITFIHEGAGYRNTLGYFLYGENETPASIDDLELIPVFPNASFSGSGGALQTGNTVYIGEIPINTKVGFFIIANGWNGSAINWNQPIYTTIPDLNPENSSEWRKHLATLYHEEEEMAIMGFEDINRENSGCDHDFNDLVFTVQWNPMEAVSIEGMISVPSNEDSDFDGVADNNDHYPNDPDRAYDRYYPAENSVAILAFEDLYPQTGDYDFNDLVIKYSIQEVVNADLEVVEINGTFTPLASGATRHNGFALSFGTVSLPSTYEVAIDGVYVNGATVETIAGGEVIATLFPDIKTLYSVSEDFINTQISDPTLMNPTITFSMIFDTPQNLEPAPYNPFIFRTGMEEIEVHLPDYAPTSRFDLTLFGTGADNSNSSSDRYFRTSTGLPWAVHLSETWQHPQEGIDILQAYNLFDEWVGSAGKAYRDWEVNGKDNSIVY